VAAVCRTCDATAKLIFAEVRTNITSAAPRAPAPPATARGGARHSTPLSPITHPDSFAASAPAPAPPHELSRRIRPRSTTRPLGSDPTTLQLFLPKSIPRRSTSIQRPLPHPPLAYPDMVEERGGPFHKGGRKGKLSAGRGGGFPSKIHPKVDFDGLPLAFRLTGGEASSDSGNFAILLDIGPDITPRAVLGDKGYDARAKREAARRRGVCPAIPYRENAAAKPAFFPKILYKGRARAEQGVGKFKRFKRIALRCEKTTQNFAAFISLAGTFILVKSVHTA
jgi:transposase